MAFGTTFTSALRVDMHPGRHRRNDRTTPPSGGKLWCRNAAQARQDDPVELCNEVTRLFCSPEFARDALQTKTPPRGAGSAISEVISISSTCDGARSQDRARPSPSSASVVGSGATDILANGSRLVEPRGLHSIRRIPTGMRSCARAGVGRKRGCSAVGPRLVMTVRPPMISRQATS